MLDANAAVPLYAQFEQKIELQIANRALHPGDRLPTEAQLARENGVSVITVRKAIDGLVRKGLLECKQGKGTFVRRTMFVDPLKDLTGISNMLSQMQVDRESVVPVLEHIETPALPTSPTTRGWSAS